MTLDHAGQGSMHAHDTQDGEAGWFELRAQLQGSVAVVTGGAGGLGLAVTVDLLANGVRVAVVDRDTAAVQSLVGHVDDVDRLLVQTGDARDPAALEALFDAVDEQWARLDTLVNVVGGTFKAPFVESTPKGWATLISTNYLSVLHACHLAVPRMQAGRRGGSIINVSTIEAHRAAPGFAVYSGAKAAVEHFARTLAVELAPDHIRVNNVAPDYVPTPNLRRMMGDRLLPPHTVDIGIPMRRAGEVNDVSHCVVFLASALSAYVTGTTLHPDGGALASSGWFNWPGSGWANFIPAELDDWYVQAVSPPGDALTHKPSGE